MLNEIQIDGHTLVARALNPGTPGTPVFLLHGITGSLDFWTPELVPALIERGPCYALSLPGHYPAVFPPGFRRMDLTADLIAHLLGSAVRTLAGGRPAILVGYSTGGFAALDVAAHAPELACGVISIAGFAQGRWSGALGLYQRMVRGGAAGVAAYKALYRLVQTSRSFYRWSARIYAADVRALYAYPGFEDLVRTNYPPFRQLDLDAMVCYFQEMPEIDIAALLPRICVPTLAMAGDHDPIVPPAQSRLIAQAVPGADLALLPGAGHMPFSERPTEYQRALKTWLSAHADVGR